MGNGDKVQWDPARKLEEGNEKDPLKDKLKEQPGKPGKRTESERKEVVQDEHVQPYQGSRQGKEAGDRGLFLRLV